jgi:hypothetical protein
VEGYVKDIVYKTHVTSINKLKLRIVAVIERVTPQILKNAWRGTQYRLDILGAKNGSHAEAV